MIVPVTERLLKLEKNVDESLLYGGFLKKHVLYRGLRVAMIPAAAVACIVDLALGILANIVRLTGYHRPTLENFAMSHMKRGLELPGIVFEQILRFLNPSEGISSTYRELDRSPTQMDEEEQRTTWVQRNLKDRLITLILCPFRCLFTIPSIIYAIGHGACSLIMLGSDPDHNERVIEELKEISKLVDSINETAVTILRLPL